MKNNENNHIQEVLREIRDERLRLIHPPELKTGPKDLETVRFYASCDQGCQMVLERAKSIMTILNDKAEHWPSLAEWRKIMPDWFIERCAPEMTKKEVDTWLENRRTRIKEDLEEAVARDWTLSGFLFWMKPDMRQWFWWDARVFYGDGGKTYIGIAVSVFDWPFAWESLGWLFKAAGANELLDEDELYGEEESN